MNPLWAGEANDIILQQLPVLPLLQFSQQPNNRRNLIGSRKQQQNRNYRKNKACCQPSPHQHPPPPHGLPLLALHRPLLGLLRVPTPCLDQQKPPLHSHSNQAGRSTKHHTHHHPYIHSHLHNRLQAMPLAGLFSPTHRLTYQMQFRLSQWQENGDQKKRVDDDFVWLNLTSFFVFSIVFLNYMWINVSRRRWNCCHGDSKKKKLKGKAWNWPFLHFAKSEQVKVRIFVRGVPP